MKSSAIQGYLISRAMLDMYVKDKDNKTDDDIMALYHHLTIMVQSYVRKKHNIFKQVDTAWKELTRLSGGDNQIEVIPFACNLVMKNPNAEKHKVIRDLALRINKKFLFVKEDSVVLAKRVVNEFYGVGVGR